MTDRATKDSRAAGSRKPAIPPPRATTVEAPPGGWPLPPDLDEILEIFRAEFGERWHEPPPDAVRVPLDLIGHLQRIGRERVDAFLDGEGAREVRDAIRTLFERLPAMIADADAADEKGRRLGVDSNAGWVAGLARKLFTAVELSQAFMTPETRPDRRRGWHWRARFLAEQVRAIGDAAGVKISLGNAASPGVRLIAHILRDAGFVVDAEAVVKTLRDRAEN